jgi:uncharacterized SAM-binding protein YcdF (DUF218 family)
VTRILAVLGYSERRDQGLNPVCAARVARALAESEPGDVVVLSGWSRDRAAPPEAELMLAAWTAPYGELVCDVHARTTAGSAAAVASLARTRGASSVVVVTSAWHAPRAKPLFRGLLRGTGVTVEVVGADGPRPAGALLRELARWPLVPFQIAIGSFR